VAIEIITTEFHIVCTKFQWVDASVVETLNTNVVLGRIILIIHKSCWSVWVAKLE